jgi:sodium transport system permease protein
VTDGRGEGSGKTPTLRDCVALILIVALLFMLGGLPLQLLMGEAGLIVAQLGLLMAPALLFVRWGGFDPIVTLSLRLPTRSQLTAGLLVLVGGVQVAWFLAWAQSLVMPVPVEYLEAMAEVLQADSIRRFAWLVLVAALVPAVAEEVLFRGVLLSGFRNALPTVWAVVGVGLVFGLFHLSPVTAFRFLPTAWLGILLAWVVVASGSLPLAMVLHFLNNGAILALTALPLTRDHLGGPEDHPPFFLVPVGMVLLVWGMHVLQRERSGRDPEPEDP